MFLLLSLFLLCAWPRSSSALPVCEEGRITKIRSAYLVVANGNTRVLLYTDDALEFDLDDNIHFEGDPKIISTGSGFFHYDFAEHCRRNGIYYAIDCETVACVKKSSSLRGRLMNAAKQKEHSVEYLSALFGLHSEEGMFQRFLAESGISVSCVLSFVSLLFSRLFVQRKGEQFLFCISFLLCMYDHFSFACSAQCIYRGLGLFVKDKKEKTGWSACILMILYPQCVLSPAFFIPYSFRFFGLFHDLGKLDRLRISWLLQSLVFQEFNPFFSVFYRTLMPIYGLYWIGTVLEVLGIGSVLFLGRWIDAVLGLLEFAQIRGSVLGIGFLLYLSIHRFVKNMHAREIIQTGVFLLFFVMGWYHPLAEVSMINVGQGDCILLRAPFNTCNVLIDTGKQRSSGSVLSYLDGLGIQRIDCIFISHADEDHIGGLEDILEHCDVRQVVEGHQDRTEVGPFVFYDLNPLQNDDLNASSQVLYTSINGLSFLFTGDMDKEAENRIMKYNNLLQVDVLKAAHHGSATASSRAFLNQLRPCMTWISCGSYDIYHHPSPSVIQTLLSLRIPYFTTVDEGDLRMLCAFRSNIFLTSTGKIAIIRTYDRGS